MDATKNVTEAVEVVTTATTPVVAPEMAPVMVTPNIEEPKTNNHVWGYAAGAGAVVVIGAAGFGIYKLVKHFKAKKEAKNAAEEYDIIRPDQTVED